MPLHPQAQAVVELLESLGDPSIETDPPEAVRAARRARLRPSTIELPEIRDVHADGVRCRVYRPSDDRALGLFVYLHGGGWVLGDLDTHDHLCRALASLSGHAVLAADYALAPERPFPAGLEDAVTVARWAHARAGELGCDPRRLAIGGDSSGANLAAVVTQQDELPFLLQVLVYPVTDARAAFPSCETYRDGPWLTGAAMRRFVEHYLSGDRGSRDDPSVSPLLGSDAALASSPPTFVLTAELDPLRDEGEAYAERLRSLGVPATVTRYEGMFHGFLSFADLLDDGRRGLEEIATVLADGLR